MTVEPDGVTARFDEDIDDHGRALSGVAAAYESGFAGNDIVAGVDGNAEADAWNEDAGTIGDTQGINGTMAPGAKTDAGGGAMAIGARFGVIDCETREGLVPLGQAAGGTYAEKERSPNEKADHKQVAAGV